jgi:hypothetical protein
MADGLKLYMMIYIIQENGEPYPVAYSSYMQALHAVKRKHRQFIEERIQDLGSLESIENFLSNINVLESVQLGKTRPYIDKGLDIVISRLGIYPAEL